MDAVESVAPLDVTRVQSERTQKVSPGATEPVRTFDQSLASIRQAGVDSGGSGPASEKATMKLQAMFISQMMSEIFREESETLFGEGVQGDFYASVFSDAIAEKLARQDALGFGSFLNARDK